MRKKVCFLFLSLLLLSAKLCAQEIQVRSFHRLERDLLARVQPRLDLNGNPCSIVRIVSNGKDLIFEGNIIGIPLYFAGEAIVYMPQGSRRLTIRHSNFGTLRYEFPNSLENQTVYEAKLKLIGERDSRWQTLVMPILGSGKQQLSYGLMLGFVKKTGAYVKAKTDFNSFKFTDGYPINIEVGNDGAALDVNNKQEVWLTDGKKRARFAVTGGVLQRLWKPLFLYAGAGYGVREVTMQTTNGWWAQCNNDTYRGVEAELGGIFRIKAVALSLGVQTNSFKYLETNVGVGYLF